MAYQTLKQCHRCVQSTNRTGGSRDRRGRTGLARRRRNRRDLTKAATESNEVRYDGMRTRGRHGIQKTMGSWTGEASLGSFDAITEAITRDTCPPPI